MLRQGHSRDLDDARVQEEPKRAEYLQPIPIKLISTLA